MLEPIQSFFNTLADNATFFIALSMLLGLIFGSFLNVVVHRLPKILARDWHQECQILQGQAPETTEPLSLAKPRSSCPNCKHQISAIENIPVLSFIWLKGQCSACKAKISLRYPLVELLAGLLLGAASYTFGFSAETVFAWGFILALLALALIDMDTQLLPDDITLPLLWLGLLCNLNHGFTDLQSAVVGAMAGYFILWATFWLFKLVTDKDGMGYGDFKLLAAIGAWLGWQLLPAVILISSVLGVIIGIALIAFTSHGRENPIPFGPMLSFGGLVALFFGHELVPFYSLMTF